MDISAVDRNRSVLISGIAMLVVGLLLDISLYIYFPLIVAKYLVINVVIGTLLIALWWKKPAFITSRLGVTGTVMLSLFIIFVNSLYGMFGSQFDAVLEPGRYETVLKVLEYPEHKLIAHFPSSIPAGVEDVRFYFQPKVMQGALILQLRYKVDEQEINGVLQKYSSQAKQSQAGYDKDSLGQTNGGQEIPLIGFRNKQNNGYEPLPKDFMVFVLDKTSDAKDWNHGYSYGVAVSKKSNEIIYWAEYW